MNVTIRNRKVRRTFAKMATRERRSIKTHSTKYFVAQITDPITPWLLEPRSSMQHSQRHSNNRYPEPNQPNSSYWNKFFKIRSNIVLLYSPWPSWRSFPLGIGDRLKLITEIPLIFMRVSIYRGNIRSCILTLNTVNKTISVFLIK